MKRQGKNSETEINLGNTVISKKLAQNNQIALSPQKTEAFSRGQWSLMLNTQNLKILSCIKKAQCQKVDIISIKKQLSNEPPILQSISCIFFTSLIHLNLDATGVKSIEALSFLNMETLEFLELERNFITCLKPISKVNWRGLNKLSIHSNKMSQVDLSRTRMNGQMNILSVDFYRSEIQMQNGNNLIKVQFSKPVSLQFHMSPNSIIKENLRLQVMKKMGHSED